MSYVFRHRRTMAGAQVRFRRRFKTLMTTAANQVAATILKADADGVVPVEQIGRVSGEALVILDRVFVGRGGREVVRPDGMPQSPFARMLLEEIGRASYEIVARHGRYMREHTPGEVRLWLEQGQAVLSELDEAAVRRRFPQLSAEDVRLVARSRLFDTNAWAAYERAHTWVDPRGYRLSDRIWRVSQQTRDKLDAFLVDAIASGMGSQQIARQVTQFLIPGREKIRTNKPYGSDASYDAMRLARTEIAHAANRAAYISAYLNPHVSEIEVTRSANGDPTCTVCPQHATIGINGERLREPYPIDGVNLAPYHPHCMCAVQPVARESVDDVVERLRLELQVSREHNLVPVMTPIQIEQFTEQILGQVLWSLFKPVLPEQPQLL